MENKQYTECYIAFLDMLGFKKMIEKKDSEEILSIFEQIERVNENIHRFDEDETIIYNETLDALKIKVMSDSICFYIDVSKLNALETILLSCAFFQASLLGLSEPILLRGAIVRDKLYANGDILFGPGLTQAYLMEEHNAKYPRIIITKDVLDCAKRDKISDLQTLANITAGVTFRDFDAFYTVDFIMGLMYLDSRDKDKKIYNRFKERISHVLNSTIDESIREKYLYLERTLKEHYFVVGDSNA